MEPSVCPSQTNHFLLRYNICIQKPSHTICSNTFDQQIYRDRMRACTNFQRVSSRFWGFSVKQCSCAYKTSLKSDSEIEREFLATFIPVHSKAVHWCWGWGFAWASPGTKQTIYLKSFLCVLRCSHVSTEMNFPKSVVTELEHNIVQIFIGMPQHKNAHDLKSRT